MATPQSPTARRQTAVTGTLQRLVRQEFHSNTALTAVAIPSAQPARNMVVIDRLAPNKSIPI